ncbi:Polyphenol oxidase 1 [Ceratocystis platani]|uniref:tyrosinase n=1 Tax=Ceratocystis fimbriata f. sp. platani TaxID=88771 RepID=A0A0F8CNX3_CERFI|nr:Polyphenol oxidase 1 [Ceratocystis platani]
MLSSSLLAAVAGFAAIAQASLIPVTGRTTGIDPNTNAVPMRRNINDLYNENGPEFQLYVQAMAALQAKDPRDPESWFQIMGIHGAPTMPWNEEPQSTTGIEEYCPHSEEIFATWHRPYTILYEQALGKAASDIAATYPVSMRDEYQQAADRLRCPYWDWAEDYNVPPVSAIETLTILRPNTNGSALVNTTMPNPLYTYRFPTEAMNGEFANYVPTSDHTRRCPDANGVSQPLQGSQGLASRGLKEAVYNTFTRSNTFFSAMSQRGRGASFESPHGVVHVYAACGEQLLSIKESAFDPLFMLHHTQVDRLIAMWQAMYPSEDMFNYSYQTYGTYTIPADSQIDNSTELGPFRKSDGGMHSSMSVRRVWDFGYSYEGIQPWSRSADEMVRDITSIVNTKYGPQGTPVASRKSRRHSQKRSAVMEYFAEVNIVVDKFPRPCSMLLFLNDKPAGTFTMLAHPMKGIVNGEIPLQNGIEAAGITGNTEEEMLAAIQKAMVIKFEMPNGTAVPVDQIDTYRIDIEQAPVVKPTQPEELPSYGVSKLFEAVPKLINVDLDIDLDDSPSFKLTINGLGVSINIDTSDDDEDDEKKEDY